MYEILLTKRAKKHLDKVKTTQYYDKVKRLINLIKENPFCTSPSYEKLQGKIKNTYSRRINSQHRLVYEVDEEKKIIRILSVWSHYEAIPLFIMLTN